MRSNPQEFADLITFTAEILNGKLHFFEQCIKGQIRYSNPRTYLLSNNLCSESSQKELFDAQFKCFS